MLKRVMLELSTLCNQSCPSCPNAVLARPRMTMEPTTIKRAVAGLAGVGPDFKLWLHLFGEPLLNPFVVHAVRLAKEAGIPFVGLSTNGVLLNARTATGLLAAGIDRIEVSIDSLEAYLYRSMRGDDSLAIVLGNLRRLIELRNETGATTRIVVNAMIDGEQWREGFVTDLARASLDVDGVLFIAPAHLREGSTFAAEPESEYVRRCTFTADSLAVLADGTVAPCYMATSSAHLIGAVGDEQLVALHERLASGGVAQRFADHVCAVCPEASIADRYTFRALR